MLLIMFLANRSWGY